MMVLRTDDGALVMRWQEFERVDDDYVYRAGFKMPANDRCVALPLPVATAYMQYYQPRRRDSLVGLCAGKS